MFGMCDIVTGNWQTKQIPMRKALDKIDPVGSEDWSVTLWIRRLQELVAHGDDRAKYAHVWKWAARHPVDKDKFPKLGTLISRLIAGGLSLDEVREGLQRIQQEHNKHRDYVKRCQKKPLQECIRKRCEEGTAAGHRLLKRSDTEVVLANTDGVACHSWLAHLKH